jgi:nucleotide-binding universal stress UspA family protein
VTIRDVLVHLDSGSRAAERLGVAVELVRRHGARLTGLFAESGSLGPSLVDRRVPENVEKAAHRARTMFDARCAEAKIASRWWQLEGGENADVVGRTVVSCRYVDLAVFGQQRGDEAPVPAGLLEQVIADSGRPILVVPSFGSFREVGRRILVAWTGSREAARALNDALPLLARAEKVTVLSLQLPAEGTIPGGLPPLHVTEHLRAHGVEPSYEKVIVRELGVVDDVLNRASDSGTDLTVIGAYGLQGGLALKRPGTTRAFLETMTTPLLLSC